MKIKKDQLNKIKSQQEKLNELITNIGLLESQKHGMLHEIAKVNADVQESKQELEEEYGAININLEDGTYTKIEEDVESNKED